jgi:hypothetical protein
MEPALNAFFMALAAGAMIFVSVHELLPMAARLGNLAFFGGGLALTLPVYLLLRWLVPRLTAACGRLDWVSVGPTGAPMPLGTGWRSCEAPEIAAFPGWHHPCPEAGNIAEEVAHGSVVHARVCRCPAR